MRKPSKYQIAFAIIGSVFFMWLIKSAANSMDKAFVARIAQDHADYTNNPAFILRREIELQKLTNELNAAREAGKR